MIFSYFGCKHSKRQRFPKHLRLNVFRKSRKSDIEVLWTEVKRIWMNVYFFVLYRFKSYSTDCAENLLLPGVFTNQKPYTTDYRQVVIVDKIHGNAVSENLYYIAVRWAVANYWIFNLGEDINRSLDFESKMR